MTYETTRRGQHRCPNPSKRPLDGGWGWMVVLGCSLMHLLVAGFSRSYAVIFIQLQQRFHSSAGVTAWVGGTCTAIRMGLSPIATSLSNRFGTRPVIFTGGLFLSLGCLVSAFAPNTEFLFFSHALLTGVGGTLAYAPSLVLVGQYFDKYRGIAVGLGSAGSGIGVFVIPPVMNAMFGYYGYTGTFLIMAAVMLNVCICGALHRPLEASVPHEIKSTMAEDRQNERNIIEEKIVEEKISSPQDLKDNINNSRPNSLYSEDISKIKESSGRQNTFRKGCASSFNNCIDLSLCKDPVFLLYIFAMGLHTLSYGAGQMLIPAMGQIRGHSKISSTFLLSILGIAETIGRISSGFIFDVPILKRHRPIMYNVCLLVAGSCHLMWAFCTPYSALAFACTMHGLSNGCVVSQRTVMLSDLLGVERLSSSFGLTIFIQGCAVMIGPAVAGVILDVTGHYTASYIFTFTSAMLGTSLFFLSANRNLWCCAKHAPRTVPCPTVV